MQIRNEKEKEKEHVAPYTGEYTSYDGAVPPCFSVHKVGANLMRPSNRRNRYSSGLAMLNFPVWCSMLSFNIVHFAVCQAIIRIKTDNTIFGNSSPYLPTYAIAEVPSSAFWLCRGWILLCQPPFCDWRVVHWPTAIMAHH
ncbi:hypothetical protein T4D_3062 [Trichinella pseudospiralis]|uniref:Uncharacterized protein n=1 Tax=Trichinella pseudospiralis TaxID=6337 RepID=A0A0V1FSQ3_TRIPS|nr:hypothetical protein T4D_3062 [Trichinella pseudospiralis]